MEMKEKWPTSRQLPCAAAFSWRLRLADRKPVSAWTCANQFKVGFALAKEEVVVMATASLNLTFPVGNLFRFAAVLMRSEGYLRRLAHIDVDRNRSAAKFVLSFSNTAVRKRIAPLSMAASM